MAHSEAQFFQLLNTENSANQRIDEILGEPVDKDLSKSAETSVNNILTPTPPKPPEDKKEDKKN
jgi:hypothetical protein